MAVSHTGWMLGSIAVLGAGLCTAFALNDVNQITWYSTMSALYGVFSIVGGIISAYMCVLHEAGMDDTANIMERRYADALRGK